MLMTFFLLFVEIPYLSLTMERIRELEILIAKSDTVLANIDNSRQQVNSKLYSPESASLSDSEFQSLKYVERELFNLLVEMNAIKENFIDELNNLNHFRST